MDSEAVSTIGKSSRRYDRIHLGLIIIAFLAITAIHYASIWMADSLAIFGSSQYTVGRILYLLPVVYASYIFGRRGGLIATAAAFVALMSSVSFMFGYRSDAVVEIVITAVIGIAISLLLNLGRRQKDELQQSMKRVEQMHRDLNSQIALSTEQQKRLATFTAFSAMLSQSLEFGQVLSAGTSMVMGMMRVEVVIIFALDEEKKELRVVRTEGLTKSVAAAIDGIRVGEGLIGRVAETSQPIVTGNLSGDPRMLHLVVRDERLRATVIVPLMARGRIAGVLAIGTRQPRNFEMSEVDLLAAVANQIGIAMENSRLYQEQAMMVDRLRLSEERYRQLFENAHDAIWVQDLSGKNIAANDAAAQLIGYQCGDEIVGKDVREFIPPESLALAREIRDKLARGEAVEQPYEQRLIRIDGREVILKLTTSLITSGGRPTAFQHIARDITTERRLQENMRYYVQQITEAQEEESKRIARELHDSTLQNLIASVHNLENFCQSNPEAAEMGSGFLRDLRERLRGIVQEIRVFSRDLRPSILDDLGLIPSVEWLVEELRRSNRMQVHFEVTGTERRFSPPTEVALFRIIQEALRNIVKHALATVVEVKVEFRSAETVVTLADNGIGFEAPRILGELPRTGKLGLLGMQERARLIDATLEIRSAPGQGTTLTVTVPVEVV
ncbi:MAG: PAS domain S-box protein [Chloroflexota bacterium]